MGFESDVVQTFSAVVTRVLFVSWALLTAPIALAQMGDGITSGPTMGAPYNNSYRYQDTNGNSYRITPTQSGQYRIQTLGPSSSPMPPSYGSVIPRNY